MRYPGMLSGVNRVYSRGYPGTYSTGSRLITNSLRIPRYRYILRGYRGPYFGITRTHTLGVPGYIVLSTRVSTVGVPWFILWG